MEKIISGFPFGDAGQPLSITLANGIYIDTAGLKPRLQNALRRLAAYSNS